MKVLTLDYLDCKEKHFINDLKTGLRDTGFVIMKNHPISDKLISDSYKEVEKFFLKTTEYKNKFKNKKILQSGYIPFGIEKAKDSKRYDLKEFFQVVNEDALSHTSIKNIWTDDIKFNKTMKELYRQMYNMSEILLEALLGKGLDTSPEYLKEIMTNMNSVLRIIHYPPLDGKDAKKGHVRASAHEDINLITIMPGASETGLEILGKDGVWIPIEANYNYLIIDSGDMLTRITNDEFKATTHRVVNPSDKNNRRFSMPFFCHPNPKATLKCIDSCRGDGEKYEEINAEKLLNERLKDINLKK